MFNTLLSELFICFDIRVYAHYKMIVYAVNV